MNARFERNQAKIELKDDTAAADAASSQKKRTKLESTQPNVSTKFEKIDPDYLDDDSKSSSSSSSSLFYESDEEKSDEEENESDLNDDFKDNEDTGDINNRSKIKKSVEEFGLNKKFFKVKNQLFLLNFFMSG